MLSLAHAGTTIASAFVASLVEAVEALTIVLAVGTVRGWRPALAGTVAGLAFLALLVLAFGPLLARMPIEYLQLEVGFIVLAVGAVGGLLVPASLGALAACALVAIAGCAVHRPLARIPENTLKFAVGVLLSAFGAFWVGEGLGLHWPGDDLAILGIAALFLAAAAAAAPLARGESAG